MILTFTDLVIYPLSKAIFTTAIKVSFSVNASRRGHVTSVRTQATLIRIWRWEIKSFTLRTNALNQIYRKKFNFWLKLGRLGEEVFWEEFFALLHFYKDLFPKLVLEDFLSMHLLSLFDIFSLGLFFAFFLHFSWTGNSILIRAYHSFPQKWRWFSPPLAAMLVLQRTKLKLWRLLLHSHINGIDSLIHRLTSPGTFW